MPSNTELIYNHISLGYIHTSSIEQVPVTDPSGTDYLYTKFTINVRSVIAVCPGGSLDPAVDGETPAETIKRIRHMLLSPRRELEFRHGGKTMLFVPPEARMADKRGGPGSKLGAGHHALDAANGPKPLHCTVTYITEKTFGIDYSVECCLEDCDALSDADREGIDAGKKAIDKYLSLRYTMSQTINEDGYSTLTTSGKLIARANLIFDGGPDTLRSLVTPLPIPGYKRTCSYTIAADGLSLNFQITDQELYLCPPPLCTKASGTHTISTGNYGGKFMCDVTLHLEGRKETSKVALIEMAVAIAMAKLQNSSQIRDDKGKLSTQKMTITDHMYGPAVDVHLSAMVSNPIKSIVKVKPSGSLLQRVWDKVKGDGKVDTIIAPPPADQAAKVISHFDLGQAPYGSHKSFPILLHHELRGNLPFIVMLAAAFNDPCLAKEIKAIDEAESRKLGAGGGKIIQKGINDLVAPSWFNLQLLLGKQVPSGVSEKLSQMSGVQYPPGSSELTFVEKIQDEVYVSAEMTDGVWDDYDCKFSYHRDTGRRPMPSTKSGSNDVAFPKIYDDVMTVSVSFVARKIGTAPTVPRAESEDDNLVLLEYDRGYPATEMNADGEIVYTQTGIYTYGAIDHTLVDETWPIPPWMKKERNQLAEIKYMPGIDGTEQSAHSDGQITRVDA